jgi:hypothetical protein
MLLWGAFNGLIGIALVAFSLSAAALISSVGSVRPGAEVAAGLTAGMFIVFGATALVWAALHAACGRALRAHRPWARTTALVLAVLNLLLLPFGTALGIYALWVLLHDETRRLFEGEAYG